MKTAIVYVCIFINGFAVGVLFTNNQWVNTLQVKWELSK